MANTLIENVLLKQSSLQKLIEKYGPDSTGYLVIDEHYTVVDVNMAYREFENLYTPAFSRPGKNIKEAYLTAFPAAFVAALKNAVKGQAVQNFRIDHLEEQTNSFKITALHLSEPEYNLQGACMFIKPESKLLMSKTIHNDDFFKQLIDHSTNVYQLADAALVYTYSSKGIEAVLGFSPAELIGISAIQLVHPDDKESVRDWLIDVRRYPDKLLTCEYRVRNREGEYIWIENNARNLLADSQVKAIVMNFRNVQAKKVADNALIHAEQRLSLLLNNTEESFIILNSRLRIVTYNKAAQDRSPFFYNKELQSGLSVLDLIPKAEVDEYFQIFEKVFAGSEVVKETKFLDSNNSERVFNHAFRPLFDDKEDIFGVFITSTEITERKKLTEEVALHSERLKTAQQIARLGYFEYDFAARNFYCSEQLYDILKVPENIRNWNDLAAVEDGIFPEDLGVLKTEMKKSMRTGKDFSLELRLFYNAGSHKVMLAMGGTEVDAQGKPAKFRITLQDVTDSKMAMQAIATLEAKFKSLFDHSIDGVILSTIDGNIFSANPAICRLLGYDQAEIISLHRHDLIDLDSAMVVDMLHQRQTTGSFMGETMLRHKNGRFVAVEVTSITMKDETGENYISTIVRDITEKKKIENEQKLLTEELLKNNQDLQQFSFITSHNLRAPVANLLSLLSLYNRENPLEDFNKLLIEKFEEATLQLNQTLNDLINVLVIKSNNNIEREPISFSEIFNEVKKNVDNLVLNQHGQILANFAEVDKIVYNRIHVESIFLNMLTNAIRYSSPDRPLKVEVRSYRQNEWIVVEFADNGLGMDLKRYGDRLFGLYQRFHGNKEGKGLGLYMTRSQVVAMGGKIEVESEPGKGSTFKIFFKI